MSWNKTEPLRLYVYALLVPLAAVLVWHGIVSDEAVPLYLALAEVVLGAGAVEGTRRAVASPETQQDLLHGSAATLEEAGYTVVPPDADADEEELG